MGSYHAKWWLPLSAHIHTFILDYEGMPMCVCRRLACDVMDLEMMVMFEDYYVGHFVAPLESRRHG